MITFIVMFQYLNLPGKQKHLLDQTIRLAESGYQLDWPALIDNRSLANHVTYNSYVC